MFAGKDFTPAQIQEVQLESPAENVRLIAFRNFLFSKVNEWKF